jgi:hypothetical protein
MVAPHCGTTTQYAYNKEGIVPTITDILNNRALRDAIVAHNRTMVVMHQWGNIGDEPEVSYVIAKAVQQQAAAAWLEDKADHQYVAGEVTLADLNVALFGTNAVALDEDGVLFKRCVSMLKWDSDFNINYLPDGQAYVRGPADIVMKASKEMLAVENVTETAHVQQARIVRTTELGKKRVALAEKRGLKLAPAMHAELTAAARDFAPTALQQVRQKLELGDGK